MGDIPSSSPTVSKSIAAITTVTIPTQNIGLFIDTLLNASIKKQQGVYARDFLEDPHPGTGTGKDRGKPAGRPAPAGIMMGWFKPSLHTGTRRNQCTPINVMPPEFIMAER
jgi:hypothetical protein